MSVGDSLCTELVFFVNGRKVVESNVDPSITLLTYLRDKLRLCGTKLGCGEGGCGACTVMVSKYHREQKSVKHMSVNACLAPVCAMHGLAVTTIEGIGSTRKKLHAVQERIAKMNGSQCGFCTPGIVMSMYTLLRNNPLPMMHDVEEYFKGNLCRCTGYRPILESMKTFTVNCNSQYQNDVNEISNNNTNGNGIVKGDLCEGFVEAKAKFCSKQEQESLGWNKTYNSTINELSSNIFTKDDVNNIQSKDWQIESSWNGQYQCPNAKDGTCCMQKIPTFTSNAGFEDTSMTPFTPYDPTQEPIFPTMLKLDASLDKQYLKYTGNTVTWYRPLSMSQLLELKTRFPDSKVVVGNTEVGVEVRLKNCHYPVLINPSHVKELNEIFHDKSGVKFGASVTLDKIEEVCKELIRTMSVHKVQVLTAIVEMLQWFAGKQIRNVASVGGNVMTGSPISDLNPIFLAAGCKLEIANVNERKTILMDDKFFTGYRRTVLQSNEILVSITIPFTEKNEIFYAYKQARRRDDDIAIVNAAFRVFMDSIVINKIVMCYGGLAATTKFANATMKLLKGKSWSQETIRYACDSLIREFNLPLSAPGGMVAYRQSLAASFFFKFALHVMNCLRCMNPDAVVLIDGEWQSAIRPYPHKMIKSHQFYKLDGNHKEKRAVGQPIPHKSAHLQASGEAIYTDDLPRLEDELYLSLVLSKKAHARILAIDVSEALQVEGVVDFVCHEDLPGGRNKTGTSAAQQDEEVFVSKEVQCVGQIIGAIVAKDKATAILAANLVKVDYEDLPAIITIEDAIDAKSFLPYNKEIERGDVRKEFLDCDYIITGDMRTGAQEHFYLETNACLAVPLGENGEITLYSSTQALSTTQRIVANALGVECNKIVCKTKRIGGGFGGKETRSCFVNAVVAVAAVKLNKPVRLMLDRDQDMVITGWRHPFLGKYKVGFNKEGAVKAVDIELFSNAGWSIDLSFGVMNRGLFHSDNGYFVPNLKTQGLCCRTNLPSNTAFRGFGSVQGMMMADTWMDDVATLLEKDPADVRRKNLYTEGQKTHYNQELTDCTLTLCWDECLKQSNYYKQRDEINEFNASNRWKKRGIAIVPSKYGVGFGIPFLNQSGAFVNVYLDGSVLVTHGGVEMGQGLHTKMIQVASTALNIDQDKIFIAESSTDKVPNTSPSAASVTSDLNGMAIIDACTKLLQRLQPYKKSDNKWEDWVQAAYHDQVSLSAVGFYGTPDLGYNFETNSGRQFDYYTYGAGCSVVEIDCLTGDHHVIRTDIVMDVGQSLNPTIDIGQIEGAFMQGYGLFVMEQLVHSPTGHLLSRGPGAYKIPGFGDVPEEFNVSLLPGTSNPRAVYSSKAVGEPPLFLAASVFFAIKHAIYAARKDVGLNGVFKLEAPATAERIRMACEDEITRSIPKHEKGSFVPWSIQI